MAGALPLPYKSPDEEDPVQGNFDFLRKRWPLTRKDMGIESPHEVGAAGETAFQNSWTNYDPGYEVARYWKDPMGLVHIQGMVKDGTIGSPIFTLPEGYRPRNRMLYVTMANGAIARVDVLVDGTVTPVSGSNIWFSINVPPFRQEN